jgi:hypothetical protein
VSLGRTLRAARHNAPSSPPIDFSAPTRPQRYGTQYRRLDGRWHLWPVRRSTSDAERRAWSVPTLSEAKSVAERWNANVIETPSEGPS